MNTTISAIRSLRRAARESKPEALLAFQLKAAGIAHEREAQVIPGRRYRFDFCLGWLLVEVNGGVWAKGASGHSSGTGITLTAALTQPHASGAQIAGSVPPTPGAPNQYYRKRH